MAFTIPDNDEAFSTNQSIVMQTDINALTAGIGGDGVVGGCAVTAQGSPDMTCAVASGVVRVAGVLATVTAGNVTITTANGTNPRIDLVVVNSSGTKSVTAGTAAASPKAPDIPASSVLLAMVYVPAAATAITSTPQLITDKRLVVGDALLSAANVFTAAQTMPANGLIVGTTQLVAVSDNVGVGKATAVQRLSVHDNGTSNGYVLGVHTDDDALWAFGIFNDTFSTTAHGITGYVGDDGSGWLKLGSGDTLSHHLHISSTADDHIRLQRGTESHSFVSYVNGSRTWTFDKPAGDVGASNNALFRFSVIGGIDSINPFWSGFQWLGHTVTQGGSNAFPILTMYSRSALAADPTDYEFLFSLGNIGTLPAGLSFFTVAQANSFLRFGFEGAPEGMRLYYNGTYPLLGIGKAVPTAQLHIGTNGSVGHIRMDGIAGSPASPTPGDHWYDTTQKSHRFQSAVGTSGLAKLLKAQTSIQAGDTVATTASETNFATNFAIPASALTVGKVIRIRAWGVYGTLGSGTVTLQLKLKAGTTTLLDSAAITTAISIAARVWRIEADITVITVGGSGTLECKGVYRIPTANTDVGFSSPAVGGDATVTVDTTASQTLQISAQHGASSASNTIKMRQFIVEILD